MRVSFTIPQQKNKVDSNTTSLDRWVFPFILMEPSGSVSEPVSPVTEDCAGGKFEVF